MYMIYRSSYLYLESGSDLIGHIDGPYSHRTLATGLYI